MLVRVLLGGFYSNAEEFSGFNTLDTWSTASILDVCTAGTASTRAYVLIILPVHPVFGPSVLLILPVLAIFRQPVLQYSQYSEYEICSMPRVYPEYELCCENLSVVYLTERGNTGKPFSQK